jgi:putative spermidine/putrescine transport system permease protein
VSRYTLWVFCGVVIAFLLFPIVVVVPISLNETRFIEFPPQRLSLTWYRELGSDPVWLESFKRSLIAGVVAVVVAVPVGTLAALSLVRGTYRGKSLVRLLVVSPLLVPLIVLAVGLYHVYSGYGLIGSPQAVGLAHSALALPFVVLVMSAAVQNFDERLEAAARTLGATTWQAFWKVTFPALKVSLAVSALLAFVTSFDEVVLALFVSSGGETLPVTIYQFLKTEISPAIASVSTVLIVGVSVLFAAAALLQGRRRPAQTEDQAG